MDGMEESESTGGGGCCCDGEKSRRTLIGQRILTLAETDNCFPMRSFCHQVVADGLIKLDSSENIWETTRAADGHGSLGCTVIACWSKARRAIMVS